MNKKKLTFVVACVLVFGFAAVIGLVFAATNIDPLNRWAWNEAIGWIDFYESNTVVVQNDKLIGYASSSVGDISLDCATTRNGNICGTSNYGVTNDGGGDLSGWGWNDVYGWISFCGGQSTADCPGSVSYRVSIDNSGFFQNFAWSDAVGWISFNCADILGGCSSNPNYSVRTSWIPVAASGTLDSNIFDTGVAGGAQFNSILWQGSQPAGTEMYFQLATSNSSSGSWAFIGPDGTANTFYQSAGPGISIPLSYAYHNNQRFFRYRLILFSDAGRTATPRVDRVIVNWSP